MKAEDLILAKANDLVGRFETLAISALTKQYVSQLTQDEACAICFFAGIPYSFKDGKIVFERVALDRRDGKWVAIYAVK